MTSGLWILAVKLLIVAGKQLPAAGTLLGSRSNRGN
jgi:hypothetical protein